MHDTPVRDLVAQALAALQAACAGEYGVLGTRLGRALGAAREHLTQATSLLGHGRGWPGGTRREAAAEVAAIAAEFGLPAGGDELAEDVAAAWLGVAEQERDEAQGGDDALRSLRQAAASVGHMARAHGARAALFRQHASATAAADLSAAQNLVARRHAAACAALALASGQLRAAARALQPKQTK